MPSPALSWRWIDVSIRGGGGGGGKVSHFPFFSIPALQRRPAILGRNRQSPRREWGTLGLPIYQKLLSKNRHSAGISSQTVPVASKEQNSKIGPG